MPPPGNPPEPWYTVAASCVWLFVPLSAGNFPPPRRFDSPQLQQTTNRPNGTNVLGCLCLTLQHLRHATPSCFQGAFFCAVSF